MMTILLAVAMFTLVILSMVAVLMAARSQLVATGEVTIRYEEPIYDFERFLNNNIENGIQFLWNYDRFYTDLWLDWEQQILQGDPFLFLGWRRLEEFLVIAPVLEGLQGSRHQLTA